MRDIRFGDCHYKYQNPNIFTCLGNGTIKVGYIEDLAKKLYATTAHARNADTICVMEQSTGF